MLLLQLAGIINRHVMLWVIEVILVGDFVVKSPIVGVDRARLLVDGGCVDLIFRWEIKPVLFVYLALHAYSLYMCIHFLINRNKIVHYKRWGPLMTQVMVYTQPLLMYGLSMITYYKPFRVTWAVLACLKVLDIFPAFNHVACCVLITSYFYVPHINPQYIIQIGQAPLDISTTNYAIVVTFVIMLILLNVYSNPHPDYTQNRKK